MKAYQLIITALCLSLLWSGDAQGRGFGGFHAESAGAYHGWGGTYAGSRSVSGYSGWRGAGSATSYDRSWSGRYGGSISTEGARGFAMGPRGGFAAGGERETTVTGPEGRSYSGEHQAGFAAGPYGRSFGGASGSGSFVGPRGAAYGGWHSAYAGRGFPTDYGLSHYTSFGAAGWAHATPYWSHSEVAVRAGYVRSSFACYNCFHPAWYAAHPGCWHAAGWAAGAAWGIATWPALVTWYSIPVAPIDYDFGNTVVYQNNLVYVNGQESGTVQESVQQADALATQGQQADASPQEEWKPLGIFALVPGKEDTSNNIFQLAINKDGILRGNYYDAVMDTNTEVYGSVDKKTQEAAWTIGKKKDRIFEAGLFNLTKPQAPVLVHFGADQTQQWLLVRMEKSSEPGLASGQ